MKIVKRLVIIFLCMFCFILVGCDDLNVDNEYTLNVIVDSKEGNVNINQGSFKSGTYIDLSAISAEGYEFVGWYENNNLVSDLQQTSYQMPENDVILNAVFKIKTFTCTFYADDGITVIDTITYNYGDWFDYNRIPEKAETSVYKYEFIGWAPATPSTITRDYVFLATFNETKKTAQITLEWDNALGKVTGRGGTYNVQDLIRITATPNEGITFSGWFIGENRISQSTDYEYIVTEDDAVTEDDVVIEAKFIVTKLLYKYYDDDGTVLDSGYVEYGKAIPEIEIPIKEKDETYEYTFERWSPSIPTKAVEDCSFTAVYKKVLRKYELTVLTTNGGNVTPLSGEYSVGETVNVIAVALEGYDFTGWYENDKLVSTDTNYTFKMGTSDYTLKAVFSIK